MKKNVAGQSIGMQMITAADGTNFTGAVTVYITGDNGTQAAGSVGAGACTHEGNGYHSYAPSQAETNYDHIAFTFVGTGAITGTAQVYPSFPQTGDSYSRLGAPAGASIAADIATVDTVADAIKAKTDQLTFTTANTVDAGVMVMAANTLTASALAADAVTEIQSGLATAAALSTLQTDATAILADTAEIGAAGAGLTALPWNAAWDAEVQSEVTDALNAYDSPTNAEMTAAFTEIKGATWATTDTLEAIRDRGDAAWTTATGFSTHTAADVWAVATRVLTAGTNIVLAKGTGVTGFNDLDAAGVRSAVGLAAANLDTQLSTIDSIVDDILLDTAEIGAAGAGLTALATAAAVATVDTVADSIKLKTDLIPASPAATGDIPSAATIATAVLTTQMTESYAADGVAPTVTQALHMIQQGLTEFSITDTTVTVKKLDGTTTAATFTLDNDTAPTSRTRAT